MVGYGLTFALGNYIENWSHALFAGCAPGLVIGLSLILLEDPK